MKKIKVFSIATLLILAAAWTCSTALAATATGSFTYDFSTDPPCNPPTLTKNCIDHFQIFDVTASPSNVALTSIVPPTPLPNGPATLPFSFKVGAPYGSRKWAIQAIASDSTGAFVGSDITAPQAQATVTVKPGAPASFVVTLQ